MARVVTVFGSAAPCPDDAPYLTALALGREIATRGWTLCNGGYGGTMEAAARGAVEAGGHTIGVTLAGLRGRGGANEFIRQEVPTFSLMVRLDALLRLGDGYVVLPGGSGTLLELAAAVEYSAKGLLRRRGPLVLLGEFWLAVIDVLRREMRGELRVSVAPDAAAACDALEREWNGGGENAPPVGPTGQEDSGA